MFGFFKKKNKTAEHTENIEYAEYEEVLPTERTSTDATYPDDMDNRELDPNTFGESALTQVDRSLEVFNNVTSSIKECVLASQKVDLEIARMSHDLDKFILQSNNSLAKFKGALPVLDRQLTKVSDRIDKITDKMLDNTMDPTSSQSIQKHQMMMDMLTKASDSFNDLLAKLINL